MSELIGRALVKGRPIATYRHRGDWIDVGTVDSFHRGDEVFRSRRDQFLPPRPAAEVLTGSAR
jgi:NDP-sugar pyrophosphorylase family protein